MKGTRFTTLAAAYLLVVCFLAAIQSSNSQQCAATFDLIYVVDNSGSIRDNNPRDGSFDNWQLMLDFMSQLVQKFVIGSDIQDVIRVAGVDFGNDAKVQFNFQTNSSAVNRSILSIQYRAAGEKTNTSGGIYKMMTELVGNVAAGDRPGVENVAIIITDGKSTDPTKTLQFAAEARNLKDVTIYVIGVTPLVNETEVRKMSSLPQEINKTYWKIPNFQSLEPTVESIARIICQIQAPSTTTTTSTTTTSTTTSTSTSTTTPTTTTTTTTTLRPQVVTTSLTLIAGASTNITDNTTILIVVIVFSLLLLLGLGILLLVCCCYGPLAAWCAACCGCCAKQERIIDRRKAVIVPFSTAVVKPEPFIEKEPEYGEISTQCDLRVPVPLPKPAPPPEVRTEVILQPVCSVCKNNIDECECNTCPYQCEHDMCTAGSCSMCHPTQTCPQCYPQSCGPENSSCQVCSHNRCSMCDSQSHHHGFHHNEHNHHHHQQHNHLPVMQPVYPHGYTHTQRRGHHHTGGYLSDTNRSQYLSDANHSARSASQLALKYASQLESDVESCNSKIYLVPQTSVLTRSIDQQLSRGNRKPRRKRRGARRDEVSDSDVESRMSKSYVYLPLDCPEKAKEETQSYLNQLYTTSRSRASSALE